MTHVFVIRCHSSTYILLKELPLTTTNWKPDASVHAVGFVYVVPGEIQMIHLCCSNARHAARSSFCYHLKRNWDDFSSSSYMCWSTGCSDKAHRLWILWAHFICVQLPASNTPNCRNLIHCVHFITASCVYLIHSHRLQQVCHGNHLSL